MNTNDKLAGYSDCAVCDGTGLRPVPTTELQDSEFSVADIARYLIEMAGEYQYDDGNAYTPNDSERALLADFAAGITEDAMFMGICKAHFAPWRVDAAAPAPAVGDVGAMNGRRAVYFLQRLKRDEKMLGPNEQASLDFAIHALTVEAPAVGGDAVIYQLRDIKSPGAWIDCHKSFYDYWMDRYPSKVRRVYGSPPATQGDVELDFQAAGRAGPFPVINGVLRLPAQTMADLAHRFRIGYVKATQGDARDAARWRYMARKLCLTGNGDGTCRMHAINFPAAIPGWPESGQVEEFCGAAIDAAIAAQAGGDG